MKRKKIYVCAPWRGETETEHLQNKAKTVKYWYHLYRIGYHPIAPQLLYGGLLNDNDPQERRDGLDAGLEELQLCDEVWVFGERITEGMRGEIREAVDRGIPIKYIEQPDEENEKPPASWHSQGGKEKPYFNTTPREEICQHEPYHD